MARGLGWTVLANLITLSKKMLMILLTDTYHFNFIEIATIVSILVIGGGIAAILKKGLNEIIVGLKSIDEQLKKRNGNKQD